MTTGQGDYWQPGTPRFEARLDLLRAVERFVDAVDAADAGIDPTLDEFATLRRALRKWRELGRDGE